jgi:type I restriction enzyme, S subunit
MREDWVECSFEDLLDYEQPTKYIVRSIKYNNEFKIPVLTAGKSFIKGFTNEKNGIFDKLPTIIFDDFTTASQFVDFKFKVKSSAMKILIPTSKLVNMKFVFYCMQVNKIRSDTHKRYWISTFAKKKFLLPPLVLQNTILTKIENLFTSLDKGIADLKKVQEQLKIYRQAVLEKAFEGKLSELGFVGLKDDRMTENEKILQSNNPNSNNLPTGWKWMKLGEVIEQPKYGTSKKCTYKNSGIGVLRIPNIVNGIIDATDLKYADFSKEEIETYALKDGDILTIRSNGSVDIVGKCALISKNDEGFLFAGYLIRLRPNQKIITPKYLLHILGSHNLRVQVELKAKSTSGVNNINSGEIQSLQISLPTSLNVQKKIIQQIESRLSVCDKLEQSITESLEKAEALRQSILKKAFEGKLLTEAEIEKCKQEADYEPASVLLERIKKEKAHAK